VKVFLSQTDTKSRSDDDTLLKSIAPFQLGLGPASTEQAFRHWSNTHRHGHGPPLASTSELCSPTVVYVES
jgi:hypothetical protein